MRCAGAQSSSSASIWVSGCDPARSGRVRHRRVRPHIDEDLFGLHDARRTIVEPHLELFRRDEPSRPPDQPGAGLLEGLEVVDDLAVDHVALARTHPRHVRRSGAGACAKLRGVMHDMGDPRAPHLVLVGHAGDVGQEPPIHFRSTQAVRRPDRASSQASSLPPCPLPRMRASYRSANGMSSSISMRCGAGGGPVRRGRPPSFRLPGWPP
jgi:hypothetical protein